MKKSALNIVRRTRWKKPKLEYIKMDHDDKVSKTRIEFTVLKRKADA